MRKKERLYNEALKKFNRSAGQIKRYHPDIDTGKFLEGAGTAKAVEKALDRLKFMVERRQIEKRMAAYEVKREEYLKRQNQLKIERQHRKAFKSLNKKRPGLKWSREDYDTFWDAFGNKDLIDEYGSEQLIVTGDKLLNKVQGYDIKAEEVAQIALEVAQEFKGTDQSTEDMVIELESRIDGLIKERCENDR